MAQRLIKSVAHIQAADVAVTGPAQVVGTNTVLQNALIHHQPDGRGPDEEPIVVEVNRGVVAVVMETEFRGIALGQEILNVHVPDVDLLMARFEGVQTAVRVFLQKIEPGQVVVDPVRTQISEDADAGLLFGENKSTEIADELLNARPDGDEIKIRAHVVDLGFDKTFLEAGMGIEPVGAVANVNIDQASLAGLQEIEVEFRRKANAEIDGPKTGVAFEKIEGEAETLRG